MDLRARVGQQGGSLPLAVLVAIVVGGLVIVLISRTMLSQEQVRFDRDFQLAVNSAEAGLSQALNVIQTLPAGSTTTSLDSQALGLPSELQGNDFEWTAEKQPRGTWHVRSTGWHGEEISRVFEAEVDDGGVFTVAAFGRVGVRMVGGNTVSSFPPTGYGTVGTNGLISIIGNSTADLVLLMGPDAECQELDADTNTCNDNPIEGQAEKLDFDAMIEDVEAELDDACGGSFEPFDLAEHGTLHTGETYCFTEIVTDNHESIDVVIDDGHRDTASGLMNPGAKVYVSPGPVQIGNHNDINCPGGTCPDPDASALQITTDSPSFQVGNQSHIAAAIMAPKAICHGSPSSAQVDVYGSLICNRIGNASSGNQGGWDFHFDVRLLELGNGRYEVTALREEVGGSTSFSTD